MNREELKQFLGKCYGYQFRDTDTIMNAFDDIHTENENYHKREENIIKYLEDKIKEQKKAKEFTDKVIQESSAYESGLINAYQDILGRVRSGKYE